LSVLLEKKTSEAGEPMMRIEEVLWPYGLIVAVVLFVWIYLYNRFEGAGSSR